MNVWTYPSLNNHLRVPQNMIACQVDDKQQNYELQEAGRIGGRQSTDRKNVRHSIKGPIAI